MSAEYLRFWSYLPRLALSLVMSAEVWLLVAGANNAASLLLMPVTRLNSEVGGFASGIAVTAILALAIVFGCLLLDTAVAFLQSAYDVLLKCVARWHTHARGTGLAARARGAVDVAFEIFRLNESQVLDYVELRGAATPAAAGRRQELTLLRKDVRRHMHAVTDKEVAVALAYFGGVTQEKKFEDHLRRDIHDIYDLWVAGAVGVWVAGATLRIPSGTLLALGGLVLLVCGTMPLLLRRRRRLAMYLLYSYLDTFVFSEPAENVDRDAL